MRNAIKIAMITVAGLIIAIVVYPFMHESGHALASLIFGGKVIEYDLLPIPNVLTDITGVSKLGLTVIGMSGIVFPFFLSAVISPKSFVFWYLAFVFKGIVLLSSIISSMVVIFNRYGLADPSDDMIRVLQYGNIGEDVLLGILSIISFTTVFLLFRAHPIKRILNEF